MPKVIQASILALPDSCTGLALSGPKALRPGVLPTPVPMGLTLDNELSQRLAPTGAQCIVSSIFQRCLIDDQVMSMAVLLEPVFEGLLPGQFYPILQPGRWVDSKC